MTFAPFQAILLMKQYYLRVWLIPITIAGERLRRAPDLFGVWKMRFAHFPHTK